MSRVKVTTLRSVHIGNGNLLQNNTDFVVDGNNIYVIDPEKVLDIIGIEKLDYWVSAIERRENLKEFLGRVGKNCLPNEYASRVIDNYSSIQNDKTLKECIHDGRGYPYIPGSPIKGAIRTAILSSIINSSPNRYNLNDVNNSGKMGSSNLEKKLFGDVQDSLFKYLRVGDAFFDKGSEVAIDEINLNIRNNQDNLKDVSKLQSIEVISYDCESECNITLALDNHRLAFNRNNSVKPLPNEMQSLSSIFNTINRHTKKLIEDDIEFWKDISQEKEGANDYIDSISGVIQDIEDCEPGSECVLRVGHASGWRFTTGAWTEPYQWFEPHVVPASRPKNHLYKEYDFPKSRRIESNSDVLGFIKLSIIE